MKIRKGSFRLSNGVYFKSGGACARTILVGKQDETFMAAPKSGAR